MDQLLYNNTEREEKCEIGSLRRTQWAVGQCQRGHKRLLCTNRRQRFGTSGEEVKGGQHNPDLRGNNY